MFRKTRTLEQIASTFTEAMEDLKNLQGRNSDVIKSNKAQVERLEQRSAELEIENEKVAKFYNNLQALLGE